MVLSVYMTVSLTVERYMSVCQPLLRHRQSWLSTPALVLPAIILSFAITSPNYIYISKTTTTTTTLEEENNETLSDDYIDILAEVKKYYDSLSHLFCRLSSLMKESQ